MNECINNLIMKKILTILGCDFKYKWIFGENENKDKTLSFEFVNKSNIANCNKLHFINTKINELKKNGFVDVEDLKISKFGRYIVIRLKTIEDYEKEKMSIEQEYMDKINLINKKILMLSKNAKI